MENASKALIVAGAILIAIILISVGILVLNQINKPLNQAREEQNSQAAQIFNEKFEAYVGTDKTAQDVRNLIMLINSNSDSKHTVALYQPFQDISKELSEQKCVCSMEGIDDSKTYRIVTYIWRSNSTTAETTDSDGNRRIYKDDNHSCEKGYIFTVAIFKN